MKFVEMLLSGITRVREFHYLQHQPDGSARPDPGLFGREVFRAAHDVGIRIALLSVTMAGPVSAVGATADVIVRELEALRACTIKDYSADEAWIGVAAHRVSAVISSLSSFDHPNLFP